MDAPALTAGRLELRPFGVVDADELHALFTDAAVRRWLLDDQLVSRQWIDGEITASDARFAAGSCGLWALRERGRMPVVGFVGFRPFFDPPELQLLYGLLPSHWGRGFATEAAGAALDYAFGALGFGEVRAATDAPNIASVAVLERLGMREWKRTEEGSHGTVFFVVSADEWAARRSRLTSPR